MKKNRKTARLNWLLLLTLVEFGVLSSQVTKVKGTIYDFETHESVSWANVLILHTKSGTIANLQGEFELNISALPVTIVVSHVGYQSDTLQISTTEIKVNLKKREILLHEVVITANDTYAINLIKSVYNNIANHKEEPHSAKAFYRQYAQSGAECNEIIEYFLDVRINSYGMTEKNIEEGRYARIKRDVKDSSLFISLTNFSDMSTTLFRLAQDEDPFYYKLVPFVSSSITYLPIREDAEDYFDFRVFRDDTTKGEKVVVVEFMPKSGLDKPAYSGKITIDVDKLQVMQIDQQIENDERLNFFKNVLYKGFYLTDFRIHRNVQFQRDSLGNYFLYSLETNISINEKNNNDVNYDKKISFNSFLHVYNYNFQINDSKRYKQNEESDIVAVTKAVYNPNFWKTHENIFNEVPIEENIKQSFLKKGFYGNLFPSGEKLP